MLIRGIQECIPVGCVPSAAVAMSIPACTGQVGGVSQHALGEGGVCPEGCLPRKGGGVSQYALRQTLPCKQIARWVKKYFLSASSFADGNNMENT